MTVPIVVYVDSEFFTKPIDSCQSDPDRSFTKAYQKHEPSGFCFHVKCLDKSSETILFTKTREEENVADIFEVMLEKEVDRVWSSEVKEMILTEEERTHFEKARESAGFVRTHLRMAKRKCETTVTIPENSEGRLIINVTCFSEN